MSQQPRRARDLDIGLGDLPTGPVNAITDVEGIRVGHTTVESGAEIHTGVTAILAGPIMGSMSAPASVPAGLFVGNGYGKLVGATQVVETGAVETPIVLTSTLSVFRVADAVVGHLLELPGYRDVRSINPVVGETNDGFLSDIRARPITAAHVSSALEGASTSRPAEGCVGAGTGTVSLGYKAGIGTASRLTRHGDCTVGVLVQSNFSGTLCVRGVPMPATELLGENTPPAPLDPGNSCMIVVAVDAPFDARQLGRLARRAVFAMGRVGSDFASGSGDYAIAVSTAAQPTIASSDDLVDEAFRAVQDATEEALLNSLFMASSVVGHRGTAYAVPHDLVRERCATGPPRPGR